MTGQAGAQNRDPEAINVGFWGLDRHLDDYRNRALKPAEIVLLLRWRDRFAGRVVELGCGAGRILGYLVEIAEEASGVDVSPSMVAYCRARFPAARVQPGDLRRPDECLRGRYDVVLAADNVLDILSDDHRREVLAAIRAHLAPDGLFIFSSHNLDTVRPDAPPTASSAGRVRQLTRALLEHPPAQALGAPRRRLRRRANRARLGSLQQHADGYAVLNDEAHDYALLHYYIRRSVQERQLAAAGYRLLECRDLEGAIVMGDGSPSTSLYYVAAAREPGG